MRHVLFPLVLTLGVFACTKKASAAPTTPPTDATATATDSHEPAADPAHEHKFEGGVKSFHDVMAPLWHAAKDDARVTNTCAAVADLVAKAGAIEAEPMPAAATDAAAWVSYPRPGSAGVRPRSTAMGRPSSLASSMMRATIVRGTESNIPTPR